MKFFTVPALLAAALLSAAVVVPWLPVAKAHPDSSVLELKIRSTVAGNLQLFFDTPAGFVENASVRASLSPSPDPITLRLPLPAGNYRQLRLDPLDRGGTVRLASARVLNRNGKLVREIATGDFKPSHQINAVVPVDRGVEFVITTGANDPQLVAAFTPPLVVETSPRDLVAEAALPTLLVWLALAAALFVSDRATRARTRFVSFAQRLATQPARAIGAVAALAVVASAYPVVFLGKSHISPNLGTVLLYDDYPTLPGYKNGQVVDVKLSDVGAVMWQHVPFSMMQRRALAQGELPLWNRYNAAGVPLLAQGQSMFGDPLHFGVVLAHGAAWAWDLKYLIAKWLFAVGLGLSVFSIVGASLDDARGRRPAAPLQNAGETPALPAALIVAAAAPFIGFFLYRINHPAFFSLCYAPWPLLCWLRVTQASTRRSVALWLLGLIVANLGLMNSGTVKEAYMLLVCVNFSGACVLLASTASWRERLGKLAAAAWAGVIFVLLTMPIWATFLQTLKSAYTGYNAVSAYQIQPTLLLGLFDEVFYRPLMTENRVFSPSLNFLLLLGLLYFLATLRTQLANRAVIALAASSLLPLTLAFGLVPPSWIVRLPFLGNIAHLDNTFSCVLIVLWSVLAGVGFARAAARLGTPDGRGDLVIAGLLLGALVFGWIAFGQAAHRPIFGPIVTVNEPGKTLPVSPFIWGYLGTLVVAALVLGLTVRRTRTRGGFTAATLLVVVGCVAALLWRHGLHAGNIGFESFTARPTTRVNFHAKSDAIEFARAAHAREPGRGFGLNGNFFPGWTGVYGLETVHGPDALVNPWLRELVTVSGVERIWDWRLYVEPAKVAGARPFFDALNVRFYFDYHSDQGLLGKTLKLLKGSDLDVYESPTAWPRAFFTDRLAGYAEPAEFIRQIRSGDGRPFAAAQRGDTLGGGDEALRALPSDLASRTVVAATGYKLTESTTSFRVRASGPGVIVLSEAFWPRDFRVELNGQRAPVLRLNHAFKGVRVNAAGDYQVTFRYVPRNFPRNLMLAGVGALLLAGSLVVGLRVKRTL